MKKTFFITAFALLTFAGIAQDANSSKKQPAATQTEPVQIAETKENTENAMSQKKNAAAPAQAPLKEENTPGTAIPAASGKKQPE